MSYVKDGKRVPGRKPQAPGDLWEQVDELRQAIPHVPEGAFGVNEYREHYKVGGFVARRELTQMVKEGTLQVIKVGKKWWYSPKD